INIAAGIVSQEDSLQIDTNNLGAFAGGDVRADNSDIIGGGARSYAADAVQEINNGLRSLVRHDALQAGNLSDQVQLLTPVLDDAHTHRVGRKPMDPGQQAGYLWNRVPLDPYTADVSEIDTTIRT